MAKSDKPVTHAEAEPYLHKILSSDAFNFAAAEAQRCRGILRILFDIWQPSGTPLVSARSLARELGLSADEDAPKARVTQANANAIRLAAARIRELLPHYYELNPDDAIRFDLPIPKNTRGYRLVIFHWESSPMAPAVVPRPDLQERRAPDSSIAARQASQQAVSIVAGTRVADISERDLLNVANEPTIHIGELDLQAHFLPTTLWNLEGNRRDWTFEENPGEATRAVRLEWQTATELEGKWRVIKERINHTASSMAPPPDVSAEQWAVCKRLANEFKKGLTGYPRLVGIPKVNVGLEKEMIIPIAPGHYGLALLRELNLDMKELIELRQMHAINSLAVRVLVIWWTDGKWWAEFQQRNEENATYKLAYDCTAAGYLNESPHEGWSLKAACADELVRESGIDTSSLKYEEEECCFFGVGRNAPTGQVDVLAIWGARHAPEPDRRKRGKVTQYERCQLEPNAIAEFVKSRRYWVPSALVTIILALEYCGFERGAITKAFSPLAGELRLDP